MNQHSVVPIIVVLILIMKTCVFTFEIPSFINPKHRHDITYSYMPTFDVEPLSIRKLFIDDTWVNCPAIPSGLVEGVTNDASARARKRFLRHLHLLDLNHARSKVRYEMNRVAAASQPLLGLLSVSHQIFGSSLDSLNLFPIFGNLPQMSASSYNHKVQTKNSENKNIHHSLNASKNNMLHSIPNSDNNKVHHTIDANSNKKKIIQFSDVKKDLPLVENSDANYSKNIKNTLRLPSTVSINNNSILPIGSSLLHTKNANDKNIHQVIDNEKEPIPSVDNSDAAYNNNMENTATSKKSKFKSVTSPSITGTPFSEILMIETPTSEENSTPDSEINADHVVLSTLEPSLTQSDMINYETHDIIHADNKISTSKASSNGLNQPELINADTVSTTAANGIIHPKTVQTGYKDLSIESSTHGFVRPEMETAGYRISTSKPSVSHHLIQPEMTNADNTVTTSQPSSHGLIHSETEKDFTVSTFESPVSHSPEAVNVEHTLTTTGPPSRNLPQFENINTEYMPSRVPGIEADGMTSFTKENRSIHHIFIRTLDRFERNFYTSTFTKLSSISPVERQENGISFVQSGLFLYLLLTVLSFEVDMKTREEIDNCMGFDVSDTDKIQTIQRVVSMLPASSDDLKFRWSSRLVLGKNVSRGLQTPAAAAMELHVDRFNGTEKPDVLAHVLNRMVHVDSGGSMHNTFEEEEMSEGVRAALLSVVYVRARWRAAPTLLNGTRPFRDDGPPRAARMIRINDEMRYGDLNEWDAEAIELSYATPGLSLLLIVPRGRSLRALAARVAATSLRSITDRMHWMRVAATLPLYTLRMTLLLPSKLQAMGIQRLVDIANDTNSETLRLSHAVQRLMFWAEAGRNAFKDDGFEWDEPPELELVVDRPYVFFVRWNNMTLMNGNFVL